MKFFIFDITKNQYKIFIRMSSPVAEIVAHVFKSTCASASSLVASLEKRDAHIKTLQQQLFDLCTLIENLDVDANAQAVERSKELEAELLTAREEMASLSAEKKSADAENIELRATVADLQKRLAEVEDDLEAAKRAPAPMDNGADENLTKLLAALKGSEIPTFTQHE